MKLSTNNYQLTTHQKGFTLIEAVTAASIFAFVVASMLGVYITVLRLDSKTRAFRAVQQNSRFIMDFLAKEVRNGLIDYASYPGGQVINVSGQYYTQDLYLENQANEREHIYLNGNNIILNKTGVGATNLNSGGVTVTKLQFYVSPKVDPLTIAKAANQQPNVTVVLELNSNYGQRVGDVAKINLQSTFSIRQYPSRYP